MLLSSYKVEGFEEMALMFAIRAQKGANDKFWFLSVQSF